MLQGTANRAGLDKLDTFQLVKASNVVADAT